MAATLTTRWIAAASGLCIGLFAHAAAAQSANPNALWDIVHGQCVPNQEWHRDPKPCVQVNLRRGTAGGFAILKDIRGATQFLLIPTRRIGGIESRAVRAPGATDYFAEAWQVRGLVAGVLGHAMADDTLSLAVNSELARSQSQLHIHIDCIRADVRQALASERAKIGRRWTPLDEPLAGHRYSAMRVMGMFAGEVPGFVILDDHADPAHGDNAGGEELQDHACALAH
jgi:CDP-diacylglycerol pyrophosphatase